MNSDGRMIGIPTLVRAEERTLGRLGAILTVTAIRAALDLGSEQQSVPDTTFVQPTPAPGGKAHPLRRWKRRKLPNNCCQSNYQR